MNRVGKKEKIVRMLYALLEGPAQSIVARNFNALFLSRLVIYSPHIDEAFVEEHK